MSMKHAMENSGTVERRLAELKRRCRRPPFAVVADRARDAPIALVGEPSRTHIDVYTAPRIVNHFSNATATDLPRLSRHAG